MVGESLGSSWKTAPPHGSHERSMDSFDSLRQSKDGSGIMRRSFRNIGCYGLHLLSHGRNEWRLEYACCFILLSLLIYSVDFTHTDLCIVAISPTICFILDCCTPTELFI